MVLVRVVRAVYRQFLVWEQRRELAWLRDTFGDVDDVDGEP